MPCTPYNPTPGMFLNLILFGSIPKGTWSFQRSGDTMQLKNGATVADSVSVPSGSTCNWLWFQASKFVALRAVTSSPGTIYYHLWIFDLRNPAAVTHWEVPGPLSVPSGLALELHLNPAPDDSAFFIWLDGSMPDETTNHVVYRSCDAFPLSGAGSAIYPGFRYAEFFAGQTWIYVSPGPPLPSPHPGGGYLLSACDLPSGCCDIATPSSGTLDFGEVVIGGPASLASTTKDAVLRNSGNDCLEIIAVTPAAGSKFTIGAITPALPRTLPPGGTLTIPLTFDPGSVGNFGPTSVTIVRNPTKGDASFDCRGTARAALKGIGFSPSSLTFGKVQVGAPGVLRTLTIKNTQEAPITVTVPAPPAGSPYQWAAINGQGAAYASSLAVNVTFAPSVEGDFPSSLTVISDAPGSPHTIALSGKGCIPKGLLVPPVSPLPSFGSLEQGFRTIQLFTISNSGDGLLRVRLRIQGVDAALFGLRPEGGSITTPVQVYEFDINPPSPCGGGPAGVGAMAIGIVFWANGNPREVSAELVLEELVAGYVHSSVAYALNGSILEAVPIDVGLVLDRSGSMAEGSKITSVINAGRLFVHLMRPDRSDRITIVRYNQMPDVVQEMVEVTESTPPTQTDVENTVSTVNFTPAGTTSISGGVMLGRKKLDVARSGTVPPLVRRSIVVLTDGKDNTAYQNPDDGYWYSILGGRSRKPSGSPVDTQPLPGLGDIKVFAVGIGTDEQIDRGQLAVLSQTTGGDFLVASDIEVAGDFALEKHFTQIFMGLVDLAMISDPVWDSRPGQAHLITFDLLRGDASALVVIYDEPRFRLPFRLQSPAGDEFDMQTTPPGFATRVGTTPSARFVEVKWPGAAPERYAGRWTLRVQHPWSVSKAPSHLVPSGRTRFGAAIGVGSNFRILTSLMPPRVHAGDPIQIEAIVEEAGVRMPACRVSVEVCSPTGKSWILQLVDEGAACFGPSQSGTYTQSFLHTREAGSYRFVFHLEGYSQDREPVIREAVLSQYVEGRLPIDPVPWDLSSRCCRLLLRIILVALIVLILVALRLLYR